MGIRSWRARKSILLISKGMPLSACPPTIPTGYRLTKPLLEVGVLRRSVVETPTAVSVCTFVRQGLGLAIVNPLTALDFVGRGLHIRPLRRSLPFRVNAVFPEHRPANPLVQAFVASLTDAAKAIKARLAGG